MKQQRQTLKSTEVVLKCPPNPQSASSGGPSVRGWRATQADEQGPNVNILEAVFNQTVSTKPRARN